jgi:putative MATE family efflux protein
MNQSIGQKFNVISLLRFAAPSIIMMVFMSLYTIIDGFFIARYAGSAALSAANIVYPVVNVLYACGIMFATGGSAIVAKKLGQQKEKEARNDFTSIVVVGLLISILFLVFGTIFTEPLSKALGSNAMLLPDCKRYLRTLLLFAPASMLQMLFQMFFVTAGKPGLGLGVTIAGGVANAIFDYVFMAVCHMDITGAAIATGIGQLIPAVIGLIFFIQKKKSLYFSKFKIHWGMIGSAAFNGVSEMISNVSEAVVTFLYNIILMKMVGQEGVAAITIVLYAQFLFNAMFLGFSMGVAPVISYQYGAQKEKEVEKVTKISKIFLISISILIAIASFFLRDMVAGLFVDAATQTYLYAKEAMGFFAISFLFSGYNIFSSSYYTALSDGKTSGIISFTRTFICIVVSLLILPQIFGTTGVWLAVPLAEMISFVLCLYIHRRKRVEKLEISQRMLS